MKLPAHGVEAFEAGEVVPILHRLAAKLGARIGECGQADNRPSRSGTAGFVSVGGDDDVGGREQLAQRGGNGWNIAGRKGASDRRIGDGGGDGQGIGHALDDHNQPRGGFVGRRACPPQTASKAGAARKPLVAVGRDDLQTAHGAVGPRDRHQQCCALLAQVRDRGNALARQIRVRRVGLVGIGQPLDRLRGGSVGLALALGGLGRLGLRLLGLLAGQLGGRRWRWSRRGRVIVPAVGFGDEEQRAGADATIGVKASPHVSNGARVVSGAARTPGIEIIEGQARGVRRLTNPYPICPREVWRNRRQRVTGAGAVIGRAGRCLSVAAHGGSGRVGRVGSAAILRGGSRSRQPLGLEGFDVGQSPAGGAGSQVHRRWQYAFGMPAPNRGSGHSKANCEVSIRQVLN